MEYGKRVDIGDGLFTIRLTGDQIAPYERLNGCKIIEARKICDFCDAELSNSHQSQTCKRENCCTVYDTCSKCTESRLANKKYAYCFKNHMRPKIVHVRMYGESYEERQGLNDDDTEESDDTHAQKYPDIVIDPALFDGIPATQEIHDLMKVHGAAVSIKKCKGIGSIIEFSAPE